ncbi:hypothetical protein GCM10027035_21630 [Emticicia sediminis]
MSWLKPKNLILINPRPKGRGYYINRDFSLLPILEVRTTKIFVVNSAATKL